MKTSLITRTGIVLWLMFLLSNSFAQKNFPGEPAYGFFSETSAKSFSSRSHHTASPENISKKTLKKFNRRFRNASDVSWEQLDDNFLATFANGETTTKSLFDKKGRLIYAIDYSSAKRLPADIKGPIMNSYRNYMITSVCRVSQDNRVVWIIKMADKSNYAAVKVEDGEIQEIENFKRAN